MLPIVIHLVPHVLAAFFYAGLGLHFWNTRWREREGQCVACPMLPWERAAIGLALCLQAYGLEQSIFNDGGMRFSFGLALALMLWLAVLIYWLESFLARMEGMQPLVLPLAAACALLPAFFPQDYVVAHAGATAFKLHFLAAMLASSLFTLSALHAVFMGFTERALHQRSLKRSLASLPPLLTMEALLFRMLGSGFALLTLALGSGILFSEELFGKAFPVDHKTIFAFAAWGIFGTLLAGRYLRGWRGRKALRWTLAGFSLLLLAYVGSRFVTQVILGRP